MINWNVEDMKLMNDRGNKMLGRYQLEVESTREEKIEFIDRMRNGIMTYVLELNKKFLEDKENLTKDKYGTVKTVSLKAWINKNNTRKDLHIDDSYKYGSFSMVGGFREFYIQHDLQCEECNIVDYTFRNLLMRCESEERKYFKEHDSYEILKTEYKESKISTFGVHLWECSDGRLFLRDEETGMEREATEEELKELIDKNKQVQALIDKLTEETHIVF